MGEQPGIYATCHEVEPGFGMARNENKEGPEKANRSCEARLRMQETGPQEDTSPTRTRVGRWIVRICESSTASH